MREALKVIFPSGSSAAKRLIACFVLTLSGMYALYPDGIFDKKYADDARLAGVLISTALLFILLCLIKLPEKLRHYKTDSYALLISSVFSGLWLCLVSFRKSGNDILIFFILMPLIALSLYHTLYKERLTLPQCSKSLWGIIAGGAAVVMFFFCGLMMALRYYNLYCPCYDFGIFTQMFENMKDTMLPETTVERNYLLSHFAVHLSPVYYLLLPFYLIFPHPVTVQLMQGFAVVSGIIPVLLICRKRGMTKLMTSAVCVAFAFYPAFTGGVNYDFHENCLLLPLIMWLFYGIERRSLPLIAIFSVLTLTVKEDAAVYVAVIGLYLIFGAADKKMRIAGVGVFIGAAAYFIIACAILESMGLGIMSWRYSDYDNGGGLISVIKSVIANPAYVFSRLLSGNKLKFAAIMLAPLLFLPLACHKKPVGYILLIPFVLINLMPSYEYQYNIYFQYVFGSGAMLFYLFITVLSDFSYHKMRYASAAAAVGCAMMFLLTMTGMANNISVAVNLPERAETVRYLESIHADGGSITADTFFVPALYKQKQLYTINYTADKLSDKNVTASDTVLLNRENDNFNRYYAYFTLLGYTEQPVEGSAGKLVCRLWRRQEYSS